MAHTRSTLKFGDQEYELIPVEYKSQRSPKLRTYDDPTFEKTPDYKYRKLEGSRKKIRLLQLKGGAIDAPDIYCELIEADYDNRFHIPTSTETPVDLKRHQEGKGMSRKEIDDDNMKVLKALEKHQIEYEALSWCWGTDVPKYIILINAKDENNRDKLYKLRVREQLALALKYLRYPDRSRTLWIDAICIDQTNPGERNHQVQMMSRIYTRAKEVCIWLGDSDSDSKLAIPFIKEEIMDLQQFDTLCSDKRYTEKWKALMMLMQREWFSRRWVVQEIALANNATIHCGRESMEWGHFAVAVELFVEVESATHRLSEIMQRDVKFQHVPGWFEYVSDLGASLLVQATGKVFRARRSPLEKDQAGDKEKDLRERVLIYQTIDPLDRRSLLSLEYLVSTFFIFGASEPRDAVYAMLALSRDAAPFAIAGAHSHDDKTRLTMMTCEPFLEEKPFTVDYRRPYSEVCKDFVSFAIERRKKSDPSQALDVLCRPWALPPKRGKSDRSKGGPPRKRERLLPKRNLEEKPWTRRTRDPANERRYLENEATPDTRSIEQYWEESKAEKPSDRWKRRKARFFPKPEKQQEKKEGDEESKDTEKEAKKDEDMDLPSWVAQVSQAPIRLDYSPGIEPRRTGRSNADPLVGSPQDGHRNYSAAQTRPPKLLEFRRRPRLKHYSLYVNGFIVDEVDEVVDASQGGNIPLSWLKLAGWQDTSKNPPSDFWRTLVADRGRDNRNPPYYYATACRESATKGGIASGRIDTGALINNERNSIVAEFCRRVHAVIWNRRLFKTKQGKLGLAINVEKDDKICILYGCTVPVVLHGHSKTPQDEKMEKVEDRIMILRRQIQKMEMLRQRKADHIARELTPGELEENRQDRIKAIEKLKEIENKQLANGKQVSNVEGVISRGEQGELKPESGWLHHSEEQRADEQEEQSSGQHPEGEHSGQPAERSDQVIGGKFGDDLGHGSVYGSDSGEESEWEEDPGHDQSTDAKQQPSKPAPSIGRNRVRAGGFAREGFPMLQGETMYKKEQEDAYKQDPLLWYEFRGDCYLHGMMDGEAIREQFHRQIVERTFELR